jgi:hypoxanthine-guanine phosphoribosyltransferase
MQEDGIEIEKEILAEIAKRLVVKKEELVQLLEGKVPNAAAVVSSVTKKLISEQLVTNMDLVGISSYAITQKGMRAVK